MCTDLPHLCAIDFSHREALMALISLYDTTDLITGGYIIIDLVQDLKGGMIGHRVSTPEGRFVALAQRLVDGHKSTLGDCLTNGTGDTLHRTEVGLVRCQSMALEPAIQDLDNAVYSSQQDTALPKDVRL